MLSFSVLLEYYPEKKIQKSEASFEVSVFGEVTAVPVLCAILHILSEHEVKLVKRMVEYTLYYKNILIGTIIQSNEEFPNLHGSLDFKNNNLPQKIVDYINYSIENSGLFEEDEEKWENHMIENEKKFIDLIESKEWYLISNYGKTENILVPIFDKSGITWRFQV